jgi:hypothetical protein
MHRERARGLRAQADPGDPEVPAAPSLAIGHSSTGVRSITHRGVNAAEYAVSRTVAPFVLQHRVEGGYVALHCLGQHASCAYLVHVGYLRQVRVVREVSLGGRQVGVAAAMDVEVEDEAIACADRVTAVGVGGQGAEGIGAAVQGHQCILREWSGKVHGSRPSASLAGRRTGQPARGSSPRREPQDN